MNRVKVLALICSAILAAQIVRPLVSLFAVPLLCMFLFFRNRGALLRYLCFLIPSALFILGVYFVTGQVKGGLKAVLLLCGTSLSLQLFLSFYSEKSLFQLLVEAGCPERPAFMIYASVNYTLLIRPIINEIQDAQRLRGIEIPKGLKGLFFLPALLVPLMVRLVQGADHLAESLSLRSKGDEW